MSICTICGKESTSKIENLRKLELSVCGNADCVERFIKGKEGRLPICKYCSWYCKKENVCPPIERYGGLKSIDLKYPKFALFCECFEVRDSTYGKLISRG